MTLTVTEKNLDYFHTATFSAAMQGGCHTRLCVSRAGVRSELFGDAPPRLDPNLLLCGQSRSSFTGFQPCTSKEGFVSRAGLLTKFTDVAPPRRTAQEFASAQCRSANTVFRRVTFEDGD